MEANMDTYECVGKDLMGVKRVSGFGETAKEAFQACLEEARQYVKRRPDTGPLSKWTTDFSPSS